MARWKIEDAQQPVKEIAQQKKSDPGLGARLGLQLVKGLEAPGKLFDLLTPLMTGEETITAGPPLSEIIQKKFGFSEQQLEPRGTLEAIGQKFAYNVPSAALGGLPGIAQSAIGAIPAGIAKQAGAPEIAQDILQLGTEIASGRALGKIPSLKQAKNIEDTLMRAAVKPNETGKAEPIREAMQQVSNALKTEVDTQLFGKITDTFESIEKNINKALINPTDAVDLKRSLNKLYAKLPKADATRYIQPLLDGFDNFFAIHATQNPEFFKRLTARNQLTSLTKMEPLLNKAIDLLELPKLPGGKLVSEVGKYITGETERFARGLLTNPAGRKYYGDAIRGTLLQDPSLILQGLTNLSYTVPEVTKAIRKSLVSEPVKPNLTETRKRGKWRIE